MSKSKKIIKIVLIIHIVSILISLGINLYNNYMFGGGYVIWPLAIIFLVIDFCLLKKIKQKDSSKIKIISIIVIILTICIPIYCNIESYPMIRELGNGISVTYGGYYNVYSYTDIYGIKIFEYEEDW